MTEANKKNEMIRLTIDGRAIEAKPAETIIQAAGRHGIYIPHYCWHPGLSVAGNCRLCLVEIATLNPKTGQAARSPKPVIACQTPVAEGMEVWTTSDLARDCQKGMMEFLLANHPLDCPICDRGGECMLQRYSMEYGVGHSSMADKKRKFRKPQFDPLIDIERNRCIMCTRCVRFCDEIAGEHLMGVFGRGNDNYIGTFGAGPVSSLFSGNVIDLCPVGCLTSKPYRFKARPWELAQAQSTCLGCSAGCKTTYWTRNGRLYRVTPPTRKRFDEFTLNEDTVEYLCNVGRFASDAAESVSRLRSPLARFAGARGNGAAAAAARGELKPTTWEKALAEAAQRLRATIQAHGPESAAVLISPRATLEEGWAAARLAREALGTPHVDWRTFAPDARAAAAVSAALGGADGDLGAAPDVILVLNGDPARQVPVTALKIKEMARLEGARLVLLGHHHDAWLARWASLAWLCPPGETAMAVEALAGALGKSAAPAPAAGASAAGAPAPGTFEEFIQRLLALLAGARSGLIVYSLEDARGLYAVEETRAVARLKAALGGAWKAMPILSARNAVGLDAVGAQSDGGARGAGAGKPGRSAPEILDAAAAGDVKALVIFGQDALAHAPDQKKVEAALEKVETLVVLDLLPGPATERACAALPLAAPWENDGTLADIEGNLARLAANERPAEENGPRPGALALLDLARALGKPLGGAATIEDLYKEWKECVIPEAPLRFDDLRLEGPGWEFPIREASVREPQGLARDASPVDNPGDYHPTAQRRWNGDPARALAAAAAGPPPPVVKPSGSDEEFFAIAWRQILDPDPWLDASGAIAILRPAPWVEIHPADAAALGIEDGAQVALAFAGESEGGAEKTFTARVCAGPARGCLYLPAGQAGMAAGAARARILKPVAARS